MGIKDQERLFVNQKAIRNETNNGRSDKKYPEKGFPWCRPSHNETTETIENICY